VAFTANYDFITSTLNVSQDSIESFSTSRINDILHIRIKLKPDYPDCPFCGGQTKIKGYSNYSYNHMDIAGIPSQIDWKRTRYICKDCDKSFSETSPFGPEHFHQTYAVLNAIARELHNVRNTFKDIALRYHVSDTIVQLYADSFIRAPRIPLPENLGIDEISSKMAKYGGAYLCVFVDNKKRTLNEVLPNRSKATLTKYFEKIPKVERDKVKFVTIDMWEPYKDVCQRFLKNCEIAVDPFHVIEHLTEDFTNLRVEIMNQCIKGSPSYYLLKKWHKLLETDKYDLDNEPVYNAKFKQKMNHRDLYELILSISPDLKLAYELKELYREFNKNCSYEDAPEQLDYMIKIFEESNLSCYEEFVALLKHWRPEIINSFKRPYDDRKQSNALSENTNKKLNLLIIVSNGYSNFERFRARALYCLNDLLYYHLTESLYSHKRKFKPRGPYNKNKD
jgi:transposase